MKEMISFCGLDCHECGAFLATKEDDDQKRARGGSRMVEAI